MTAITYAGLAALLCEKCESASGRAQESSQEVDRLSAEVDPSDPLRPCFPNLRLYLSVSQSITASLRSWLRYLCSLQQKRSGQTSSAASSWSCSLEVRRSPWQPCMPALLLRNHCNHSHHALMSPLLHIASGNSQDLPRVIKVSYAAVRITASGSLKRSQETPLSSQAAPGAMEASQAQQPEASATANGSSVGGLHTELGSPSPQSKATGAGKAKVIRGRGPGRHGGRLPGRGRRGH